MIIPCGTDVEKYLRAKLVVDLNAREVIATWIQDIPGMLGDDHSNSARCFHRRDGPRDWRSVGQRCETEDHVADHPRVVKRKRFAHTEIRHYFTRNSFLLLVKECLTKSNGIM